MILFDQTRAHPLMFDAKYIFSYIPLEKGVWRCIECESIKNAVAKCTLRGCQDLLSPSYCCSENNDDEG